MSHGVNSSPRQLNQYVQSNLTGTESSPCLLSTWDPTILKPTRDRTSGSRVLSTLLTAGDRNEVGVRPIGLGSRDREQCRGPRQG